MTKPSAIAADDNPIVHFADRINAIKAQARDDMAVVLEEAKSAGHDPATLRKIASLLEMDQVKREERDTLLDLYRSAAGIDPPMEGVEYRQGEEDWKAADLYDAGLSVREVAKRLKVSQGKAHKLRVRWTAFKLFTRSRSDERRERPPHDPETGEITPSAAVGAPSPSAPSPAGNDASPVAATAADLNSPPEPREEVVPDTNQHTASAAPLHKVAAALPTVTMPDGEKVTPAHLLPMPSLQAAVNRNRPARDSRFEYAQPDPDDMTPPHGMAKRPKVVLA